MGLAASQARLLTITSRKSDCEYQSMRLSHQKIAMSRDMTELSNEYQNSLTQTKLVYDYYGTGDTSTPLSYSLMMTPSKLNNYLPMLLTNAEGRVVLNDKYANAARAAGIPQEGITGLPGDEVRNKFLQALGDEGIISSGMAETLQKVTYNNALGVGEIGDVTILTEQGNLDALKKRLAEANTSSITLGTLQNCNDDDHKEEVSNLRKVTANSNELLNNTTFNINDLFDDNSSLIWYAYSDDDKAESAAASMSEFIENRLLPWLNEQLSMVLDIGDEEQASALDYAITETMSYYGDIIKESNYIEVGHDKDWDDNRNNVVNSAKTGSNLGYVYSRQHGGAWHGFWGQSDAAMGINLNNIVDVYLSFFADSLGNLNSGYNVSSGRNSRSTSNLVTDDAEYLYTFKAGSDISGTNANLAIFYDTLFNQLCNRGWVESGKDKLGQSLINDPEYVQEMLQNGMMYITTAEDDGYYYQGNYATNTYLKEVADEDAIALAEARYQTEKAKLSSKEQTLDMKMKNLDTEISSLSTEYDTVKSVISKNIEKSFKRYQA